MITPPTKMYARSAQKLHSHLYTNVKTSPTKTSEHCTVYDTEQGG